MSGTTDGANADAATVAHVARLLGEARSIVVLTGAGVSAASGVPTFRGDGGLWRQYRAEDLATAEAFARDPALVWAWYDWRRQRIAACAPNPAHDVLAQWSRRWPHLLLVTQNVDGLHERAGTASLLRLHGSIWEAHCARRCAGGRTPRPFTQVPLEGMPRCASCGALDRPSVVWFGEALDRDTFARAHEAARRADLVLAIGTSAVVHPAAGLVAEAPRAATVVEINPDSTALAASRVVRLRAPAEVVLPAIERHCRRDVTAT